MKKNSRCLFCGEPATLLCDGWLGFPPAPLKQKRWAYNGLDLLQPFTCDAPMCRECAHLDATYFMCGRPKGCIHDTRDYCPGCKAEKDAEGINRRRIEDEAHANVIRAAHWRTHAKGSALVVEQGGGQIDLF